MLCTLLKAYSTISALCGTKTVYSLPSNEIVGITTTYDNHYFTVVNKPEYMPCFQKMIHTPEIVNMDAVGTTLYKYTGPSYEHYLINDLKTSFSVTPRVLQGLHYEPYHEKIVFLDDDEFNDGTAEYHIRNYFRRQRRQHKQSRSFNRTRIDRQHHGQSHDQSHGQSHDQSHGQSPDQSPGQSPNQSPDQSSDQSPNQSPNQSPDQSPGQSPGQSHGRSHGQSPDQSHGQSPDQSSGQSYGRSPDQSPDQSHGQSPDQSSGQSYGRSPDQSPDQSPGQSHGRSHGQSHGQSSSSQTEQTLSNQSDQTQTSPTPVPTQPSHRRNNGGVITAVGGGLAMVSLARHHSFKLANTPRPTVSHPQPSPPRPTVSHPQPSPPRPTVSQPRSTPPQRPPAPQPPKSRPPPPPPRPQRGGGRSVWTRVKASVGRSVRRIGRKLRG